MSTLSANITKISFAKVIANEQQLAEAALEAATAGTSPKTGASQHLTYVCNNLHELPDHKGLGVAQWGIEHSRDFPDLQKAFRRAQNDLNKSIAEARQSQSATEQPSRSYDGLVGHIIGFSVFLSTLTLIGAWNAENQRQVRLEEAALMSKAPPKDLGDCYSRSRADPSTQGTSNAVQCFLSRKPNDGPYYYVFQTPNFPEEGSIGVEIPFPASTGDDDVARIFLSTSKRMTGLSVDNHGGITEGDRMDKDGQRRLEEGDVAFYKDFAERVAPLATQVRASTMLPPAP
jgi:hypothetical protein